MMGDFRLCLHRKSVWGSSLERGWVESRSCLWLEGTSLWTLWGYLARQSPGTSSPLLASALGIIFAPLLSAYGGWFVSRGWRCWVVPAVSAEHWSSSSKGKAGCSTCVWWLQFPGSRCCAILVMARINNVFLSVSPLCFLLSSPSPKGGYRLRFFPWFKFLNFIWYFWVQEEVKEQENDYISLSASRWKSSVLISHLQATIHFFLE